MNRFKFGKISRWLISGGTALTLVAVIASVTTAVSAAASTDSKTNGTQLTGDQLYAIHCNRCHAERYPTERNAAQWKTLLTHMRVRANLPADQAKIVLKYLQENSGS
jgi:mono/diheme cytochrome c family protein